MNIIPGDFENPQVIDLLRLHLAGMHANSPPGHVFALDLSGLRRPDISFFTAWDDTALLGCGALRELSPTHGEIKSMRTAPQHLRRGIAAELLRHMLGVARARGYRRVSLETGSGEAFEPALGLYRRQGFANGDAFGDYEKSPFNQFLHLDLRA
jgi:putative acetyltransferase